MRNVLRYFIQQIEGRVCASLNVNDEIVSHLGSHSTYAINQQMGGPQSDLSTNQKASTVGSDPWEASESWQWVICHVVMSDGGWRWWAWWGDLQSRDIWRLTSDAWSLLGQHSVSLSLVSEELTCLMSQEVVGNCDSVLVMWKCLRPLISIYQQSPLKQKSLPFDVKRYCCDIVGLYILNKWPPIQ